MNILQYENPNVISEDDQNFDSYLQGGHWRDDILQKDQMSDQNSLDRLEWIELD